MAVKWKGRAQDQLLAWLRHRYRDQFQVVSEYRFHPTRRWRFDAAAPTIMVGFEMDGILGGPGGGHQRRRGYIGDRSKDLHAQALGWLVIRVCSSQLDDGSALPLIEQIVGRRLEVLAIRKQAQLPGWPW